MMSFCRTMGTPVSPKECLIFFSTKNIICLMVFPSFLLVVLELLAVASGWIMPGQSPMFAPSLQHGLKSSVLICHDYDRYKVELSLFGDSNVPEKDQDFITRIVADDEIRKFALSLGDIVRDSVFECAKKFQFRPDQLAFEIDRRCKLEVARMMGKKEFKLWDFLWALKDIAREQVRQVTGDNEEEFAEMTDTIESNVMSFLERFTGKKEPDAQDIENTLEQKIRAKVLQLLGMEGFSLEKVAKDIDKQRNEFLRETLGEWGADRFNDINNMAMKQITGKETYEFGDLTRKIAAEVFGK